MRNVLPTSNVCHRPEIAAGKAYDNMTRCGGDFRDAFAACIANAGY
jgi:hypothetical protein